MRGRISRAALLSALSAGLLTGLLVVTPAEAATATDSSATYYADQAVKATNQARRANGLRRLKKSACLQRYAAAQAEWMATQGEMAHQSLYPPLRKCGLSMVGENVAYGWSAGSVLVDSGWMQSSAHRHNILEKRFGLIAIAARQDADGNWYVSQLFGRA
ncbi:CAP domain-containing protein [Nocardioides sp.]|uniref:CAP domain-containing protein n=1 Tax=Nocardioides sp. TaxID=35761 RepID=UPI0039E416C1